jgi:hypothetical protein
VEALSKSLPPQSSLIMEELSSPCPLSCQRQRGEEEQDREARRNKDSGGRSVGDKTVKDDLESKYVSERWDKERGEDRQGRLGV